MKNEKIYSDLLMCYNNPGATSVEIRNALIQAIYAFLNDSTFKHNYESINWFASDVLQYKNLFDIKNNGYKDTNRHYFYVDYLGEIVTSEMNRYEMRIAIKNFFVHLKQQYKLKSLMN